MKKYWKSIAAIVLVVAVVATVALSTIDFRLRATDSDGNIGSGEVVEQQIEVTQPETEVPAETQPETAAPETTTTTVYNTNSEIQEATTAVEIKTEQEANAETTSAAVTEAAETNATEAATTTAETTAAATTVASHTETTAAETTSATTTQPASEEATSETETTTEEQTTTAAPDRSVRLRTNLDDGTTPYEGMTVVLTVELNGFEDCEYTIQWQRSTDNVNWEDVPGATDQSYSFTLTEETNGYYWNAQVTVKE
jgi:large repetitive protein